MNTVVEVYLAKAAYKAYRQTAGNPMLWEDLPKKIQDAFIAAANAVLRAIDAAVEEGASPHATN